MNLEFFDAHCHPYVSQFDADREEVLARMRERGVGGIVVGTDLEESKQAIALAETRDFLWASVGLHPNDNMAMQATLEIFDAGAFCELAKHPKVVAIGECGLDYYRGKISEQLKKFQRERFEQQLQLSLEVGKPLMIHCRPSSGTTDAHEEMIEILLKNNEKMVRKPIIHFFTATKEIAQKYLEIGCYISFPGVITFADLDDVVRAVPLERILTETDSPYAAPVPYRGKRNEPIYVEEVVKKIAEIKMLPVEEAAAQIVRNSRTAFALV